MGVTTKYSVAHLEGVPATNAPLQKIRPSSSLRLAFVLDKGLAFAESYRSDRIS